jgi:predicted RNase H-like HicB family nuclease
MKRSFLKMKQKIHNNLEEAFDKTTLSNARKITGGYRVIIEENDKLGYIGSAVELPTVFADGKTPADCYQAVQEALTGAVATMIKSGRKPPQSSLAEKRTEQVNVRLTAYEKLLLSTKAVDMGFAGISDLIRSVAIKNILKTS